MGLFVRDAMTPAQAAKGGRRLNGATDFQELVIRRVDWATRRLATVGCGTRRGHRLSSARNIGHDSEVLWLHRGRRRAHRAKPVTLPHSGKGRWGWHGSGV